MVNITKEIPPSIKISFLKELKTIFQKESSELIEIYLQSSKKKIAALYKSLEELNFKNLRAAAQDLRHRSIDIGAIEFSYYCLVLEMAVQEMRFESLPSLIRDLEGKFELIYKDLEWVKEFGRV